MTATVNGYTSLVAAKARQGGRGASSVGRIWGARVLRSRLLVVGLAICLPLLVVAAFATTLAPEGPLVMHMVDRLQPPNATHLMGTDGFGRDIASRVIYGARVSLEVGSVSVVLGLVVGVALGAASGYVGGAFDSILMRFMDAVLAFPAILLALVMVAILGPGLLTVMTAVAVLRVPIFARAVRSSVLGERQRDYVEAARAIGQHEAAILGRHILPNVASPIIVLATSYFASGIVVEASLSFLGLGVVPPDVSWGTMLSESREYLEAYPWAVLFPGLALSLAVLGFNLLGDGLRDLLDPRIRSTL